MDQITTPKILVVDDVEANRFALRDIIRQAGYTPGPDGKRYAGNQGFGKNADRSCYLRYCHAGNGWL